MPSTRRRRGSVVIALLTLLACVSSVFVAVAEDARAALDAFLRRLSAVELRDLTVDQDVTVYHPDGVHVAARGHERLYIKPPARHRQEQSFDGRREIRLVVGDQAWIRDAGGTLHAVPLADRERPATAVLVPLERSADELLRDWRALGVRDDVASAARIGRRSVSIIGAAAGDRASPAVWLDAEYGIVRIIARDRRSLVDLALSEHRPLLGGFHFPWRQEVFVDGKLALRVLVRAATANQNLADALFDPDALRRER